VTSFKLSRMTEKRVRFDEELPATDIPNGGYDNRSDYHDFFVLAGCGDSVFRIRQGKDDRIGIQGG